MSWFLAAIYDRITKRSEEACLADWRTDLLGSLTGSVLEAGAGTGANLSHYPSELERLILSEPDPHMRSKLTQAAEKSDFPNAEILDMGLEELDFPPETFDFVVCTLVMCSVADPTGALREIHRVLKPGGKYVFMEHVAAEDRPKRLKWQRRIEPFWKRVSGNCHLTRRTEVTISEAGFVFDRVTRESMRKALPIVRPVIRGMAMKPG